MNVSKGEMLRRLSENIAGLYALNSELQCSIQSAYMRGEYIDPDIWDAMVDSKERLDNFMDIRDRLLYMHELNIDVPKHGRLIVCRRR